MADALRCLQTIEDSIMYVENACPVPQPTYCFRHLRDDLGVDSEPVRRSVMFQDPDDSEDKEAEERSWERTYDNEICFCKLFFSLSLR